MLAYIDPGIGTGDDMLYLCCVGHFECGICDEWMFTVCAGARLKLWSSKSYQRGRQMMIGYSDLKKMGTVYILYLHCNKYTVCISYIYCT